MEKTDINPDKKVYLVAQELKLIKMLAANEEKIRNKALKNLKEWVIKMSTTMCFTEEDLQRIWKGLYYCMWMSDKPLIQEECAEKISKLIHFPDFNTSLLFLKAGLYILSQEWSGIQQLRFDKFLMLVRRLLREALNVLKGRKFSSDCIKSFNEILLMTVLSKENNTPVGLFMHFIEIFLEELAKVTNGKLHPAQVLEFIRPFIQTLASSSDGRKIGHVRKFIFTYLIRQSKLGLQYQEKYEAWREQGFPGSINSMQKVKKSLDDPDESEEESTTKEMTRKERPLDPRAGRVDVEIPRLSFKAQEVAKALLDYKFDASTSAQSRAMIRTLADQFTSLAKGVYPLGIKKIVADQENEKINIRKAAVRLIKFDQKLLGKGKKRKRDKENDEGVIKSKKHKIGNSGDPDTIGNPNLKKIKSKKAKDSANVPNGDHISKLKETKKHKSKKSEGINSETKLNELTVDDATKRIKKIHGRVKGDNQKIKGNSKHGSSNSNDGYKIESNIIKSKNKLSSKGQLKLKGDKKLTKHKKRTLKETLECIIERNSGTWMVYEVENVVQPDKAKFLKTSDDITPSKLSKSVGKNDYQESNIDTQQISPITPVGNKHLEFFSSPETSTKLGLAPVKLFESPPSEKEIFPKSSWDEPLQEGEYEICIPSKKHIVKMKKQAKNQNKTVHEIVNMTLEKIRGKSRMSLDSRLVNNPFLKPGSLKKVKINTKLNKSQEVYEHLSSVKSSPGIPFDANKKPAKTLLKPTAVSTPINPFYKKQLSV